MQGRGIKRSNWHEREAVPCASHTWMCKREAETSDVPPLMCKREAETSKGGTDVKGR